MKMRGLVQLVRDGVDAGSRRIEQLQKDSLTRPIVILREVPGLAEVATIVETVGTLSLTGTHSAIRAVNHAVATLLDAALP